MARGNIAYSSASYICMEPTREQTSSAGVNASCLHGEYLSNLTFHWGKTPRPQMTFLPQCSIHDHDPSKVTYLFFFSKKKGNTLCTIHLYGCSWICLHNFFLFLFWQFVQGELKKEMPLSCQPLLPPSLPPPPFLVLVV